MDTGPPKTKRKRSDNVQDEEDEDDTPVYQETGGFMDDESEPHKFGSAVLPVANLPDSFDGVPQDGLEYLFTVRREGRRLPIVTRVSNPYPIEETSQLDLEAKEKKSAEWSRELIPSYEWRTCFEERFRNLRANMQQATIHISIPDDSASRIPKLPKLRDRDRWWAFFRGDRDWEKISSSLYHCKKNNGREGQKQKTLEYGQNSPSQIKKMRGWVVYEEKLSWDQAEGDGVAELSYAVEEDARGPAMEGEFDDTVEPNEELLFHDGKNQEAPDVPSPDSCDQDLSTSGPREPTPRMLSGLDQKTTLHLLKYFSQWIRAHFDHSFIPPPPSISLYGRNLYDLTPNHGRWMFALLSHLDARLTSNEISALRTLARDILRLIKEERSFRANSSTMPPCIGEMGCWMIVAAVAGVWGQKDLWADAAETLQ